MSTVKKFDIQGLSQSERILLAEQPWDSVADNETSLEVTEAQKKILEERLAAYNNSSHDNNSSQKGCLLGRR